MVAELNQPELLPQAQRADSRSDGVTVELVGERVGEHVRKPLFVPVKPLQSNFRVKKK
jgi:hypothetical protein